MQIEEYDTSNKYAATVVSSERMTPESTDEVRELVLDVAGDGLHFKVGQSVGVLAPGDEQFGLADHLRLYSVSDLPTKGDGGATRIKLAVKRCFYVDDYSGESWLEPERSVRDVQRDAWGNPILPERKDAGGRQ